MNIDLVKISKTIYDAHGMGNNYKSILMLIMIFLQWIVLSIVNIALAHGTRLTYTSNFVSIGNDLPIICGQRVKRQKNK